jgi:uncharacterized protein YggE
LIQFLIGEALVFARLLLALGIAAALAVLLLVVPLGSAQTIPVQPQTNPQGISVVGQGIVLAAPNVVRITLGVDVTNQSLANAQADAAQRMDAVVAKLKADGIADNDIRTVSYNVTPQNDQQGNLRGYEVQNMVEVRSTNVGGLGALLDDVVGSGATRIFGISFEASDIAAIKAQARDQAMADALAKAQQLARGGNVGLGRPVTIEESDTGATPVPLARLQAAPAAAAPTTPIQPGQLQISTTVHIIYAIQ